MNSLLAIKSYGQQIWLDNLSRTLLREGGLKRLVAEDGINGVTSNPSIFHKAVSESPYYKDDLALLKGSANSAEARYEALVVPDVREACDILHASYVDSRGDAGYVSLEVSPHLANDEEGTVAAAHRLRAAVGRENVLIKVPSTPTSIRAFERLTAEGVNVNVTLMFSIRHQEAVAQAYIRGARNWVETGGDPRSLKSVASIFLSRVDTHVDKKLEAIGSAAALALRGMSAVSMSKLAYRRYQESFHGPAFADLAKLGVRPQYPLWASTGTKNSAYRDVLYVETLIGAETVNTVPDATLAAFRDHGVAECTVSKNTGEAQAHIDALAKLDINLDEVGEQLQIEGVNLFVEAFDKLLALME
ncbi:MAG: transaldolase [Burkholderiales bacterium]